MDWIYLQSFFILKRYKVYKLLIILAVITAGCMDSTVPSVESAKEEKKIKIIDLKKDMEVEHIFYMNHEGNDMFLLNLVHAASAESAPSIQKMVFRK